MEYKGKLVDPETPVLGIKRRGKGFAAIGVFPDGTIYTGKVRPTPLQAWADVDEAMNLLGPGRVYV